MDQNSIAKLGLRWTPYAQAIADQYRVVVPFFLTIPTGLSTANQSVIALSDPYQFDSLLFGAHIAIGSDATASDNGQQTFLNVSDERSGLAWVVPGIVNGAPATAFGGSQTESMPVQRLPEAFFLPANISLRHEWTSLTSATVGGSLTWIGVQLIDPKGGEAPKCVEVDGCKIKVGSRLPWFANIGLGTEQTGLATLPSFSLVADAEYVAYTPPTDCPVEIHDIHANFFAQGGVSTDPDNVRVTVYDEGRRRMWGLNRAPAPAVMGSFEQAYPSLPFTRPYLLKSGHRLMLNLLNLSGASINEAFAVVRGVRLCEY